VAAQPSASVAPAKPQTVATAPATTTLTAAEHTLSEQLWTEQKKLDVDSARVVAATPDGGRRVALVVARQLDVPPTLIADLRDRKLGYGELTASLALSQQLMRRDKASRQQALDKVLAARRSGQGWAALAHGMNLKLADVL